MTDPTRAALEALMDAATRVIAEARADKHLHEAISATLYPLAQVIDVARAVLATQPAIGEPVEGTVNPFFGMAYTKPTPPAPEERCRVCGGVRDDVFHEPCLTGGVFHDVKTCHPFTPPATEPSAAHRDGCHASGLPAGWSCACQPLAAVRAEGLDGLWEPVRDAVLLHFPHTDCDGGECAACYALESVYRALRAALPPGAARARRTGEGAEHRNARDPIKGLSPRSASRTGEGER